MFSFLLCRLIGGVSALPSIASDSRASSSDVYDGVAERDLGREPPGDVLKAPSEAMLHEEALKRRVRRLHRPLSILERMLARGHVCDRDLEALVRSHLEYVRDYVYRYGSRDRAHYEWTYDKVGWLRRRLDRGEIRLLDSIIQGD